MPTRVLICEDDPRFARLLSKVLDGAEGIEVAGRVSSGEDACQRVVSQPPDLLLLDLELPGIGGMEVVRRLRDRGPGGAVSTEILILTTFADADLVFEAIQLGAAGYLVKGIAGAKLQDAVREVMAGGTVIEPALARRFWNYFASVKGREEPQHGLTEEELEVLTLVARGLSNPEAAAVLGTRRRAIKTHLERIYRKLGVTGRVEATVTALRSGLIEL